MYREGMQYFIEDLGSINGTWVNGERIPANQKVAVEKGSEVVLGSLSIRLMFFSEEDENVVEASAPSSN